MEDAKSFVSVDSKSQYNGYQGLTTITSKDNVKVVIRVRPLNERERNNGGHKKCVSVENEYTVQIESKPDLKTFNFDFVGDESIEQETMFSNIARPIADGCLEGYNGTIFAYGQTGAGKTFTIQGPAVMINGEEQICGTIQKDQSPESAKRGILQRSFEYIFDCVEKARQKAEAAQDGSHFEYLIRCSYLEIYNEQIMDLLEPTSVNLHIREDIKKGVYVEGLQEEVVQSANDMISLIQTGAKNRHVGCTSMNKESSRSHSVLTTIIETKSMKEGGVWNIKTSRFHIIDLAGSERSKYTNTVGDRLKEAGMINKSLSALGNVINSLVDISEGKSRHVHYRDSKLTFLLRDSLGGNSKTVIIANISPSSICYGETLSTLKFAQRAKLIRNKAVINEDSSGTISLLKQEISRLKKELAENEKLYKAVDVNPNGLQCQLCKAMIGSDHCQDEDEDELLINNISVLEDFDNSAMNTTMNGPLNEALKNKFKSQKEDLLKMRKRVVHLEGLLSANLDSLASQQKFYESEVSKNLQQNKKLHQAVESYEKQCARDKMIIKFREDRIAKLEQNQPVTKDDQQKQILDLKKEIQIWKEASDHNSQAAKLFAEKADLQKQLDSLKAELKQTPDSLQAQMRTLTELNESLNQYLRLYCEESKKEVENELSRVKLDYAEKLEQLNEKLAELKESEAERNERHELQVSDLTFMIESYKVQVETLTLQYDTDKFELERNNKEQIEQIKNEIEQICDNKTEQEKEIQMFKVQIMEKEQLNEREKEKKVELERNFQFKTQELTLKIQELSRHIADLEADKAKLTDKIKTELHHHETTLDQERKLNQAILKEKEDKWEDEMRELEAKMLTEFSEKQMLQEQQEQCTFKINQLEEENETLQQSLIYKQEFIEDINRQIDFKVKQIQQIQKFLAEKEQEFTVQSESHKNNAQQLNQQLIGLNEQLLQLEVNLKEAITEKQEMQQMINELRQEIDALKSDKAMLEDKIIKEQNNNDAQIKQLLQQGNEIEAFKAKITEFIGQIEIQKQIQAENQKIYAETVLELQNKVLEIQSEKVQIEDNFESKKEELKVLREDLKTLHLLAADKEEQLQQDKLDLQVKFQQLSEQSSLETTKKVSSYQLELQAIQKNCTDQSHFIEMKDKQILSLEITQQGLKVMIETLQVDKQNVESQLEVLEQQLQEVEQEHTKQVEQVEQQKEQELQEVIQKSISEVKVLYEKQMAQIQEQKEQIQAKFVKQKEVNSQIDAQKFEEKQTEMISQIQEQKQQYQLQIQEIKQHQELEIIDVKSRVESHFISQIDSIKCQAYQVKQELDLNIEDLSAQLETVSSQLQDQIIISGQYEEQIETLKYSLANSSKQTHEHLDQAYFEIKAKEIIVLSLEEKLRTQQMQIQDLLIQKSKVQDQLSLSHNDIQKLSQQLDTALSQNEQLQNECSHMSNELQKKIDHIIGLEQAFDQLNQNQEQSRSDYDQLVGQYSSLKNQYIQQQNNSQEKEQIIDQLESELSEIQITMQSSQREQGEVSSQVQSYKKAISELQNQVENKIQENSNLIHQVEELSTKRVQLQQDLKRQKLLLDDTITSLNEEQVKKYQEQEQEHSASINALQQEQVALKSFISQQNMEIARLKSEYDKQNEMLKSSRDAFTKMVHKESEMMKDLQLNINLNKDQMQKAKSKVASVKEERDQARREWERVKKESENLKELIKLKDRQIEEQLETDGRDKQTLERIMKENKDLINKITKREFEMKDLVRSMKFLSDENSHLQKENEKLNRENDQLIGHKNPSQKIQHHVKIKEENNKLREENVRLQEIIRRQSDILAKSGKGSEINPVDAQSQMTESIKEDMRKLKKENQTYQEAINRVVDHILSQQTLLKAVGLSEEVSEKLIQQNGPTKVKKTVEIMTMLSQVVQHRDKELKDLKSDVKQYEARLNILEKEKTLYKQQLEMAHHSIPQSYSQNSSGIMGKRSPVSNNQEFLNQDAYQPTKQPSRLHVEGFVDEKGQQELMGGYNKQSPSPIFSLKQQREKENIQSSKLYSCQLVSERDLFGQQQRSGSNGGPRTNYLSNGQSHSMLK